MAKIKSSKTISYHTIQSGLSSLKIEISTVSAYGF